MQVNEAVISKTARQLHWVFPGFGTYRTLKCFENSSMTYLFTDTALLTNLLNYLIHANRLLMNFLRLPDRLICLSRIDQAGRFACFA